MKYFKRAAIYKNYNGNNEFNPEKVEAYSYRWWKYVTVVDGLVLFNNYYYSPTTCKHQHETRRLMEELGIQIDLTLEVPCGFQDANWIEETAKHYQNKIDELDKLIAKPRTHKKKNKERLEQRTALHAFKLRVINFAA